MTKEGEAALRGGHHVEAGEPWHREQENGNSERVTRRAELKLPGQGPGAGAPSDCQRVLL